jgi:hypothetical protein
MGEKPSGEGFSLRFFNTPRVRNSVTILGIAIRTEVDYESTHYRR